MIDLLIFKDEQKKLISDKNRPVNIALTTGKKISHRGYLSLKGKSTLEIPIMVTATPLLMNEKIIGAIDIIRDVTKEKELDLAKDEFLSLAAHQLRTPLGTSRWNLERLLEGKSGKVGSQIKDTLLDLEESNSRLISIVNSLLNVSRINQGRVTDKKEKVDVSSVIEDSVKQLSSLAKSKSISLSFTSSKQKIHTIYVEKRLFSDVIENLVSNAIKYNHTKGKVDIKVSAVGEKIRITVADTGIGIREKDTSKIFTKFYRTAEAISKGVEGTGLGLFIVKSYIDRWKGKVTFESIKGKGTVFTIVLPASE